MYRVLELNKEDESFEIMHGDPTVERDFHRFVNNFVKEYVHPCDQAIFLKFFYERIGHMPHKKRDRIFFRRKFNDEWKLVVIEAMEYKDPIILLIARDVESYINDFMEQIRW